MPARTAKSGGRLICPHEEYLRLAKDPRTGARLIGRYKAHLDDALVERIREATNGNYALGDRWFQAEIEQALGRRVTKSKAGRPKAQPEHRLAGR